jgi:hypothetical protein
MGRRSKNETENTPNDCVINFTLRKIDLRNHHKTSTENTRTDTQQKRETSIRSFFAICKRKNALCEAGFLTEMRQLNTTIVAKRILMNERHPIRHYFTNRRIQDEYAMRKGNSSPIFMKTIDKFGELGVDTRKVKTTLSYNRAHG